jgi:hypothetical protein
MTTQNPYVDLSSLVGKRSITIVTVGFFVMLCNYNLIFFSEFIFLYMCQNQHEHFYKKNNNIAIGKGIK